MDWNPEDIKAAIRKAGGSLTFLARREGVSPQALSIALQARTSERCDKIIASFLGRDAREIWPSRYREDGTRLGNARRDAAA